jgi:hypothetical protein
MARYFFNIVVRGRKAIPDPEGDELSGDKEALEHAKMVAREMLTNHILYKRGLEDWAFEITKEAGRRVGLVAFSDVQAKVPGDGN